RVYTLGFGCQFDDWTGIAGWRSNSATSPTEKRCEKARHEQRDYNPHRCHDVVDDHCTAIQQTVTHDIVVQRDRVEVYAAANVRGGEHTGHRRCVLAEYLGTPRKMNPCHCPGDRTCGSNKK